MSNIIESFSVNGPVMANLAWHNLACPGYKWEERTSVEELLILEWPVGMSVRAFSYLAIDVGGLRSLWAAPSPGSWAWDV